MLAPSRRALIAVASQGNFHLRTIGGDYLSQGADIVPAAIAEWVAAWQPAASFARRKTS